MGGNRTDTSFVQSSHFGPSPFPTELNFWGDSPSNLHCMLSLPTVSKSLQVPTSSRKSSRIGQMMAKSSPETPLTSVGWTPSLSHFSCLCPGFWYLFSLRLAVALYCWVNIQMLWSWILILPNPKSKEKDYIFLVQLRQWINLFRFTQWLRCSHACTQRVVLAMYVLMPG